MSSTAAIAPEPGMPKTLDANRYATKKTIAQGMLDIALLTANASQLKYVLQAGSKHEFYSLMVGLISTSIVLQQPAVPSCSAWLAECLAVGGGGAQGVMGVLFLSLNLLRDCRLHQESYRASALVINYIALALSVVVTALNLLISAFDPSLGHFLKGTDLA